MLVIATMMGRFGKRAANVPSTTPAVQFEDFQPLSEWKEQEEDYLEPPSQQQQKAKLLLLHLPEFKKEQLKVTYVQSSRTLRVTGDRPILNSDTKRRRFNVAFVVPQNCDATKIQGKFQDGVLVVTMPLLPQIPTAAAARQPSHHAAAPVEAKTTPEPPKKEMGEEEEEKNKKNEKNDTTTPTVAKTTPESPKNEMDDNEEEEYKRNGKDDATTAPTGVKTTPLEPSRKKMSEKEEESTRTTTTDAGVPPLVKAIVERLDDNYHSPGIAQKETKEASNSPTSAKAAATTTTQLSADDERLDHRRGPIPPSSSNSKKRKESPKELGGNSNTGEKKDGSGNKIGEIIKEVKAVATRKKAKGLGILERVDELLKDEDNRQAMVNVGLAVIAAVAVGAFVVYRYRSSFRDSA